MATVATPEPGSPRRLASAPDQVGADRPDNELRTALLAALGRESFAPYTTPAELRQLGHDTGHLIFCEVAAAWEASPPPGHRQVLTVLPGCEQ